ncbi:hypothetical protein JXA88_05195 [Candidatus Fermentibacteria bacterium]|nr:hypothetical protein [Candidatus Fermentibacteria bacterium]
MKRGGSWNNNAQNCRSANRNNNSPGNSNNNIGFRLVREHGHQQSRGLHGGRGSPAPVQPPVPAPGSPGRTGSSPLLR